jgi:large subunit ribosomal protein L29
MILKAKKLIEMTVEELNVELDSLYTNLFDVKMALHSRKLENISSLRELKKSIARIKTILKQKEANANA